LFVIPRLALIDQTIRAFEKAGLKHIGVIQRTHARTDPAAPLQIASADTLTRRNFQDFDLVIIDECHIAREKLYGFMKDWPRVIGLSATPWTRGMGKHWQRLIIPTYIGKLIATGYLCDFSALCPAIDLGKVRIMAGEFHEGDLAKACDTYELCANIVETWQREGKDRPTLLYGIDRNHARHLQERFKEAGVACGYVDMFTKSEERDALFEQLRCGDLKIICSVATLEVGLDLPLVSCIIDARPTKSLMRWVQTIGRDLRPSPETGKRDLLILDHAGNHNRFGCSIADLETPTELHDGSKKRSFDKSTPYQHKPLKTCDICGFTVKRGATHCPKGHPVVTASEHIESDGILVPFGTSLDEMDYPPEPTRTDKQGFYSGLRWIALEKGYLPAWARRRFKERFGCWPNGPGTRLNLEESDAPPSIEVRNFVRAQQRQYCREIKRRAGGVR
jgi:superfamily II DNA or RNA helicase